MSNISLESKNPLIPPLVGKGSFGTIRELSPERAKEARVGFPVAVKEISLFKDCGLSPAFLNELMCSRQLEWSSYIIKYIDVQFDGNITSLWMRRYTLDLRQYMRCNAPDENINSRILVQLLRGLHDLDRAGFTHRDIKPDNIFINTDYSLVIGDLGSAMSNKNQGPVGSNIVQTANYRAPEIFLGQTKYGPAIDMWSVGCVMYELYARKSLVPGNNEGLVRRNLFTLMGVPQSPKWHILPRYRELLALNLPAEGTGYSVPELNPLAADLLSRLLTLDPGTRITAFDAVNHEYLSRYQSKPAPPLDNRSMLLGSIPKFRVMKSKSSDRRIRWFANQRPGIIEWILEIVIGYNLNFKTLFLTCDLYDLVTGTYPIDSDAIYTAVTACIAIASVVCEKELFHPGNILEDIGPYDPLQFSRYQILVLDAINFDTNITTPLVLLDAISNDLTEVQYIKCIMLLISSLASPDFRQLTSEVVATAVINEICDWDINPYQSADEHRARARDFVRTVAKLEYHSDGDVGSKMFRYLATYDFGREFQQD